MAATGTPLCSILGGGLLGLGLAEDNELAQHIIGDDDQHGGHQLGDVFFLLSFVWQFCLGRRNAII